MLSNAPEKMVLFNDPAVLYAQIEEMFFGPEGEFPLKEGQTIAQLLCHARINWRGRCIIKINRAFWFQWYCSAKEWYCSAKEWYCSAKDGYWAQHLRDQLSA